MSKLKTYSEVIKYYDILLYWTLMRNKGKIAIDGFGRDVEETDEYPDGRSVARTGAVVAAWALAAGPGAVVAAAA